MLAIGRNTYHNNAINTDAQIYRQPSPKYTPISVDGVRQVETIFVITSSKGQVMR